MRILTGAEKLRNDRCINPHVALALAIVAVAAEDALDIERGEQVSVYGVITSPWELLNFFRSKWCSVLLGTTDLNGEDFIKMTELEGKCKWNGK